MEGHERSGTHLKSVMAGPRGNPVNGGVTIPEPRDLCTSLTLQENDRCAQCPVDTLRRFQPQLV